MESLEALKTIFINCKDLLVDKNGKVVKLEDLIKTIKKDLEILKILKDKVFLYIYENEPNQLYIAKNKECVTDKEKQLLKEWVNRE